MFFLAHAHVLLTSDLEVDLEVEDTKDTEHIRNFEQAVEHVEAKRDSGAEFVFRREDRQSDEGGDEDEERAASYDTRGRREVGDLLDVAILHSRHSVDGIKTRQLHLKAAAECEVQQTRDTHEECDVE